MIPLNLTMISSRSGRSFCHISKIHMESQRPSNAASGFSTSMAGRCSLGENQGEFP